MFGSSKFHIFNLEDVEEPTEVFDLTGQTEIQDAEAAVNGLCVHLHCQKYR